MLPYILNKDFQKVDLIDDFVSFIWTKRYNKTGDFELYVPATAEAFNSLKEDNYVYREDDDALCIIEKVELATDVENGDYITATGRSIESILSRRIIWQQTNYNGLAENFIYKILNENVISPKIENRKIANFFIKDIKNFKEKISIQTTGENLLELIEEICTQFNFGFKLTVSNFKNEKNAFVFELYKGKNHTSGGEKPFVVFSPSFDNLFTSEYVFDKEPFKNFALVAGEGEGTARKSMGVGEDVSGIERREMYVDARDISSNGEEISESEYVSMLLQRGEEKLSKAQFNEAFSGEVETTQLYKYKKDYNLGDIVEIRNEYGMIATPRIVEIIECEDQNGYTCVPTFEKQEVD